MTTRTDILRIKLTTDGSGNVKASVSGVSNELDKTGNAADRAKQKTLGLKQVLVALAGAAVVRGTIQTIVQFERLSASLKTVTGSADAAQAAFDDLKEFAATTPFQLQEVVAAFVKLKALGLDPSMEALRSYGNTAAAMGKDMNQFIEAVADAATGEFERLKEFGIKASSQGENVSFTFQGVTTTIRKNANEISDYLRTIGDNQFSSGMADQMETLGGSFSNLQDSIAQLASALGDAGLSDILKTTSAVFRDLATAITASIDPSDKAAQKAKDLNPAYKLLAFTVFKLKQEFVDLGDIMGATLAILDLEVGPGIGAKFDAILETRKEKRAALEKETERYVAALNGIVAAENKLNKPKSAPNQGSGAKNENSFVSKGTFGPTGADLDKFKTGLIAREAALQQSLKTEEELERASYEQRKRDLDSFFQYGIDTDITKEQLKTEHEERMTEIARQKSSEWADVWTSAGNRFAAGIGEATATAILEQKSMADSMRSLARGVLHQIISTLVEIGVKKVALSAIGSSTLAAQTAASVAAAGVTAGAWATPAALASLASFGGNAIPAAAGISSTVALSEGLALAGQAHDGLDYVPREGTYLLDKGEMVLDKGTSDAVRNGVGGGRSVVVNMPITVSAVDARGVDEVIRSRRGMIGNMAVRAVNKAMNARGQRGVT